MEIRRENLQSSPSEEIETNIIEERTEETSIENKKRKYEDFSTRDRIDDSTMTTSFKINETLRRLYSPRKKVKTCRLNDDELEHQPRKHRRIVSLELPDMIEPSKYFQRISSDDTYGTEEYAALSEWLSEVEFI